LGIPKGSIFGSPLLGRLIMGSNWGDLVGGKELGEKIGATKTQNGGKKLQQMCFPHAIDGWSALY